MEDEVVGGLLGTSKERRLKGSAEGDWGTPLLRKMEEEEMCVRIMGDIGGGSRKEEEGKYMWGIAMQKHTIHSRFPPILPSFIPIHIHPL
jgi:hypothetical protein